jgi:predicted ATPase/DNA-binding CsgD family transcriptional regulator
VHGFPAALTSFIGRTLPVREVAALLNEYRLVTVTGPGGSGKTRLAGEVARRVADRFADGVWLVELAAVRDPGQVLLAVAAALGIEEHPGVSTADALVRVLARQQLLLVLDNCEQVINAAAELCAGLMLACDDVLVLATSREPLRVSGEARYRLGPLTLPGPRGPADAGSSEAVALFADRARSADPHFVLDAQASLAVAQLVTRLDGMPLAIELAAARVEALGVAQLLSRLDDRFALLAGADRLAPSRHRSLAATVGWSYLLLDEQERRVFRLVSVFPGPFTLEAAEAVAGAAAGAAVLRLVDCSLLSPPRTDPDGRARYVMLETLRAYGAGLLAETGEQDAAAAALAGYALSVAELAAAGLQTGTGELAAARWLDAEDVTMRQVLARAMQHDAIVALRLAVALAPWWHLRGMTVGRYPVLREAADYAVAGSDTWCAAQFWLGWTAGYSGDLAGAMSCFTALRDAIKDRPPSRLLAYALACRSFAFSNWGRVREAADDAGGSLAVARDVSDPGAETLASAALTLADLAADNLGSAVRLVRQAELISAVVPGWIARVCSSISTAALTAAGDLASAERVCTAGLARDRDAGALEHLAVLLTRMVILDLQVGRIQDAAAHLRQAVQILLRVGDRNYLHNSLDHCGHLCTATGRWAEAVTVWAAWAALGDQESRDPPADVRRREGPLRRAREVLGPDRARAAEDRGGAMSLETAAQYILMLTAPSPQPPAAAPGPGRLSARERELITLVAQGRTDAQIAAQLFISVRTVRSHLDRIRDKTGCRRRADLTRLALGVGLV